MTAGLWVEHFWAGYKKKTVVEDVSFAVNRGELAGVLGENGCGKTTLLKGIAGLGVRHGGKVLADGQDIRGMSVKKRAAKVSVLASKNDIPPGLLAREVLEMGWYPQLSFLRPPGERLLEKRDRVAKKLELEELLPQYFEKLSQGQGQRVLLGRLFLQDTPLVLLDEPDAGLDFRRKHAFFLQIRQWLLEEGKTGLAVLHDPGLALTYCDRVFCMKRGKIIGTIEPKADTEEEIAEKIRPVTGIVKVTKCQRSVIIFP